MSVHSTHCCKKHGCKYGDDWCPVEHGNSPGVRCEYCDYEKEENNHKMVYAITNSATGVIYGWIENKRDFESLEEDLSIYGVGPELLELVRLPYIGR